MIGKKQLSVTLLIIVFAVLAYVTYCSFWKEESYYHQVNLAEFGLSDDQLNAHLGAKASIEKLKLHYGEPIMISGDVDLGSFIAFFDLGVTQPKLLPPVEGRIGFRAEFKDGIFVSWKEIWREVGRQPRG